MNEIERTVTELRQDLGHLVNRAAYGGDRIVLVAHGQPKAAIGGFDDLARLKCLEEKAAEEDEEARRALAQMHDCTFWRADEQLFNAVRQEFDWVHWLGERRSSDQSLQP